MSQLRGVCADKQRWYFNQLIIERSGDGELTAEGCI